MSFELNFNNANKDLQKDSVKTEQPQTDSKEELKDEKPEEINKVEIKTFDEGIKELSQLISELKDNIPSAESLTDIYNRSLSSDHYHTERSAEASILMMLRVNVIMIANNLSKYKNYSEPDSSFSKSISFPNIENIENLKNILSMDRGTSRAKFMDADNFKLHDLIDKLEDVVSQARELL